MACVPEELLRRHARVARVLAAEAEREHEVAGERAVDAVEGLALGLVPLGRDAAAAAAAASAHHRLLSAAASGAGSPRGICTVQSYRGAQIFEARLARA